jgi:ComF family protein
MPLALSAGGLLRLHAIAAMAYRDLSTMWFTGQTLVALWPLPEKSPPWSALVAVDDYVPPLSRLIHALKFSGQSSLAQPLPACCCWRFCRRDDRALPKIDMVVNVPCTAVATGGAAITRVTCSAVPRPLARLSVCALTRVHATAIQHQLSARLRKRNLKNAFRLELPVDGLHIAIVDDVVTTGSTVAELSRLLLRSGAASVQVWCLCRTL